MTVENTTGFDQIPSRYSLENGQEAIDYIRDKLGDRLFIGFCLGNAMKYQLRAGKKGPAEIDLEKASFYMQMYRYVLGEDVDPRTYRDQ